MKLLNWGKVNALNAQETLWADPNIQTYKDLPFEELEELFSVTVPDKSESSMKSYLSDKNYEFLISVTEKNFKESKKVTLIDSKRAQNLGNILVFQFLRNHTNYSC